MARLFNGQKETKHSTLSILQLSWHTKFTYPLAHQPVAHPLSFCIPVTYDREQVMSSDPINDLLYLFIEVVFHLFNCLVCWGIDTDDCCLDRV